jgi:hypothetical protein
MLHCRPIGTLPLLQNMPSTALQHRVSTGVWEARWHMRTGCRVRQGHSRARCRGGHRAALLAVFLVLALTGLFLDRPVKFSSGSGSEFLGERRELAQTSVSSLQVHLTPLTPVVGHRGGFTVMASPCITQTMTVPAPQSIIPRMCLQPRCIGQKVPAKFYPRL